MKMESKVKYKKFILLCLVLDLLAMVFLGYRYLNRKIPDEIQFNKSCGLDFSQLTKIPFVSFGDAIPVSGEGSYLLPCRILGRIPFKDIKIVPAKTDTLLVSGSTVGIYMETDGVLVIDTGEILSQDGESRNPAKNLLKPGDYIISMNQQKISCKKDLIEDMEQLDGQTVTVKVLREETTIPVSLTPVKDASGKYKLGVWVRDDTQGIGTLTYVTQSGTFGALGHGISDIDTGGLLSIKGGSLYGAEILGVQKGERGYPGELSGLIRYRQDNQIGSICCNSQKGIYGTYGEDLNHSISLRQMKIGYKQELKTGLASILCNVGDGVKEYEAKITKIDMNHEDSNKSFVIQVTDKELLNKTGGIVQGMSGSPILQNGKIVGAVTHVFVQDAASGYGIFIENMLEE